jgi:uncharacterized repeat protein (TIGR03803 family)
VGNVTWTSSTAPIGLPAVGTGGPTGVTTNSATVAGTITPNFQMTAWYVQYGTTTNYGSSTSVSIIAAGADGSNALLNVSQSIQGLERATTYHYQLVASNTAGTSFGLDEAFASDADSISILYALGNGSDGAHPYSGLIQSGNVLYGAAYSGGDFSHGAVFRINTDGTGYLNVHSFTSGDDGAFPYGGLLMSGDVLFGTTSYLGPYGNYSYGGVFRMNTNGALFASLEGFNVQTDGRTPEGDLVLSGNTLYGTTTGGGNGGHGVVFAIGTDGTGFTDLYSFDGYDDGAYPYAGLVLSGNRLYGTTYGGSLKGSVFAINTDGTGFKVLHNFPFPDLLTNSDGALPTAGLTLVGNTLYGTTSAGGSSGAGIVFAINTDGTGFTNLHNFSPGTDGAAPSASLVLSGNNLYGTAEYGSTGYGTVFAINTNGGDFTTLYTFNGGTDGAFPAGDLALSGNTLYGTTTSHGANNGGTVFSLILGSAPAPIPLQIVRGNKGVILSWSNPAFSLQASPAASGVYTNVPGATSPYTNAMTGKSEFFRLIAN